MRASRLNAKDLLTRLLGEVKAGGALPLGRLAE